MESNLVEIKRFLKDHKIFIAVGSIFIAILFTMAMIFLDKNKEEESQEGYGDYNFAPSEIMNDAQPAYFQFYLETKDGKEYGNSSIFTEYFNSKSVKEEAQLVTNIDIEAVEEEIISKKLNEEINVINITRDGSSYLFTAFFNLGKESHNLKLAKYYFELLLKDEIGLLEDKNIYIFSEPTVAKVKQEETGVKETIEGGTNRTDNNIITNAKNIIVGLILGMVFMIGLMLLKAIYGKELNYSFAYDVEEENKFILYDKNLKNEEIISQFVAAPLGSCKVIVAQENMDKISKEIISEHNGVTFNKLEKEKTMLIELNSLSQLDIADNVTEVIIVILPKITTRKWYKTQQQLANINALPTKIIQINE